MSYSEVAEQALGPVGKTVVEVQLVLSQTGFCAAYIIFIYKTVITLVPLSPSTIVLIVLPFQVRLFGRSAGPNGHTEAAQQTMHAPSRVLCPQPRGCGDFDVSTCSHGHVSHVT